MSKATPINACQDYADLLVDYSDRELSEQQRQVVGEHLASCPSCLAELARLDASLGKLTHAIQPADGKDLERSVRLAERRGAARALRMPQWAGWAAAALACLIGAWWLGLRMSGERSIKDVAHAPVVTEKDASRKISPEDALWRIAVIEQEARLAASLDLLPRGDAYAAQRENDERLLAKFQSMTRFEDVQ